MINKNEAGGLPTALRLYQFTTLLIIVLLISLPLSPLWGSYWGALKFFVFLFLIPVSIFYLLADSAVSFMIDDQKITINRGVIFKNTKMISFGNIQNIAIKRGLLLRLFGLAEINIWTASQGQRDKKGTKPDGYLKLEKADVEKIATMLSPQK